MESVALQYPVSTLDSRVLLPAGTRLTPDVLHELSAWGRRETRPSSSLLSYGTTRDDLVRFLNFPPYQTMFHNREVIADILGLMERITLVAPFLEAMDYFKTNDYYSYRHMLMVFALSTMLAKTLLPDYDRRLAEVATGPTHDFGKVCVPPHILRKNSPLTRAEKDILSHHTLSGYVLLSYYHGDHGDLAARVARDHHERRDGSGHPRGVRLDDFIVEIIAVCDIYDALVSPRPYRPQSYDTRTALEELTAMAEQGSISWEVVRALVSLSRKNKPSFDDTVVSLEKRGVPPARNLYGIIAKEGDRQPGS